MAFWNRPSDRVTSVEPRESDADVVHNFIVQLLATAESPLQWVTDNHADGLDVEPAAEMLKHDDERFIAALLRVAGRNDRNHAHHIKLGVADLTRRRPDGDADLEDLQHPMCRTT